MPFFEPLPPEPAPQAIARWSPPLWDRPSKADFGTSVGISALLAKSDRFALAVDNFHAFPNGFTFDFVVVGNPMKLTD